MDIAIWTALISGSVAIAAGYLGAVWGRRTERRQWVRNRKLSLYSDFIDATAFEGKPFDTFRIWSAFQKLFLTAPQDVALAAMSVMKQADALNKMLEDGDNNQEVTAKFSDYVIKMTVVMRLDLHDAELSAKAKKSHNEWISDLETLHENNETSV